jgi:electron transport complex protein RnfG
MRVFLKMAGVLGLVALFSGFLLAYVQDRTKAQIEENRTRALREAITSLIPEAQRYDTKVVGEYKVYYVYDENGALSGYCILTSGSGYQGEIKILIALSKDLERLRGIQVLENVETPGLGGKISEPTFKDQFKGRKFRPQIQLVKGKAPEEENEVQAITGATVSSSAVVRIINRTIREVLPYLEGE